MDDNQKSEVAAAMHKLPTLPGQLVISAGEGQEGDNFYVIQEGQYTALKGNASIHIPCQRLFWRVGLDVQLVHVLPQFELTQMGCCGAMDRRPRFRDIVLASRIDRRRQYEEILDTMEVRPALPACCGAPAIYNGSLCYTQWISDHGPCARGYLL
eukprot:jgi/Botrbrau1/7746/Bobra.0159s0176.1